MSFLICLEATTHKNKQSVERARGEFLMFLLQASRGGVFMFLYNYDLSTGLNFHHPLFHHCPVGREKD